MKTVTRAQSDFHAAKKEALAFALSRFRSSSLEQWANYRRNWLMEFASNALEQWKAQKLAEKKAGK